MKVILLGLKFTAMALLVVGASASAQEDMERLDKTRVPVIFEELADSEKTSIAFDPGEAALTEKHVEMRTTLFGELSDSSAINTFRAYWYDGRHMAQRRYYVDDRVYKNPHASIWATVDATIVRVDTRLDDKHEIRIHSYRGLTTEEVQTLARASANSQQWIADNRNLIDFNDFKKGRPKPAFVEEVNWKRDFNKLHRLDDVKIRSLDMKRGVVELICSRYVVEEVPNHHASYIDLIMVYDLKKHEAIRLLVRSGGYFLE